ncbi:hypothetical protein SAMN03159340_02530 [Sphingomonas sp. NFR15]|nr:hypothetical protein SAMN03159340_02530 [Sphingomonas sp. NFR15]
MFHGRIVATNHIDLPETARAGPIAGIAHALPVSMCLWAMIFGMLRF